MKFTVFETRDTSLLRAALGRDRVAGAYLLGDLEAPFFDQGRWIAAERGVTIEAVVLVFGAFADPVVLTYGSAEGVAAIVADARSSEWLPPVGYLKIPPEHETACSGRFAILDRHLMKVMSLDRQSYSPARDGQAESSPYRTTIQRLDGRFPIERILDVYRSYPGHFFEPAQLDSGIYFGSFEGDRLVAVAGTHVYSAAGRVAALGNIVTATDYRGKGHAMRCTSAVIDELYARGCETIVLHVAASNWPALACYVRLGFEEYGPIWQLKGQTR